MRCQCCKKEVATIQIRDIENWSATDMIAICDKCAPYVVPKFLASPQPLLDAQEALVFGQAELEAQGGEIGDEPESAAELVMGSSLTCPSCNMTLTEFQKLGRLGCPDCYVSFAEHLNMILEHIHGAIPDRHPGRTPGEPREDARPSLLREIQQLEQEMQDAVTAENYERAAELRDQIKSRQRELG